jgi:glycosyltransferase involved in cell wall biosynthesis
MSEQPFVSVIMPIRNEADFIERSLGAALRQEYPAECMEILIADGMSTDRTRAIIEQLVANQTNQPAIPVKIIDNPGKIVPTGFNWALGEARGEIIVRVDGHTVIAPNYVRECVTALQTTSADNVGGRMMPIGQNPVGDVIALATSSPFGVGGGRFHFSKHEEWVDTVYLGAWRRDVFERIGQFDEEMVRNQDDEFNYRLLKHGGKILLSPRILSRYYNRGSLRALWRQYYQYGFWKVRVMEKHPGQMRFRQFVPPLFAGALIGSGGLALMTKWGRWLFALVAGSYGIANFAVSIITSRKNNGKGLTLLPVVFATMHLSYGIGFLLGLVKRARD